MPLWEELSTLVAIMLLGHWIEMRSVTQAQGALKELAKLLPRTTVRVKGEQLEEVAIDQLREHDLVLVQPGASVPADGVVREGASSIDESMLTGESRPVAKKTSARRSPVSCDSSTKRRARDRVRKRSPTARRSRSPSLRSSLDCSRLASGSRFVPEIPDLPSSEW
jgi:P-type E1-E2 ATPase